jgi:hypothetical protein
VRGLHIIEVYVTNAVKRNPNLSPNSFLGKSQVIKRKTIAIYADLKAYILHK